MWYYLYVIVRGCLMDWFDIKEFINDTFKYFIVAVIVLLTIIYVFTFTQVVGPSMDPYLKDGDITILSKVNYYFMKVTRGDIVSVKSIDSKYLIKRVVGLPGETIEFKDNVLYINNVVFNETYLGNNVITKDFTLAKIGVTVIPKDYYLVLGDNRINSMDSRDKRVGLIKKSDIIGKVILKLFPFGNMKVIK